MEQRLNVQRIAIGVCLLLPLAASADPLQRVGPAPVAVRSEKLTLRWYGFEPSYRTDANLVGGAGLHPGRGSRRLVEDRTFDTVVLENEFLRVQAIPRLGGVVYRCVFLPAPQRRSGQAGQDIFFLEGKGKDWIPFWESGVKASFPFREHGIRPDQPASWRVVRGGDGSATLAMWMEFSRFDAPANRGTFGRFSDMTLSQHVTLRPGEALLRLTYRVANPSPWKQGWKIWNDALLPRNDTPRGVVQGDAPPPRHTDTQLVYPARWVSWHNGEKLHELTADECRVAAHRDEHISLFAWDLAAPFAGLWYPSVRVNRLRIFDPASAPGAKFYFRGEGTWSAADRAGHMYNFIELWGGPHHVFEGIEDWIAPGQARQIAHCFAYVRGIGKADFANERAAVCFVPGERPRVEIVTFRPTSELNVFADGKQVAAALACGPDRPAVVELPRPCAAARVRLVARGEALADVRLPLEIPDNRAAHERIRRAVSLRGPDVAENHERSGVPTAWGRSILRARYPDETLDAGRVALNLGQLDSAVAHLRAHLFADANSGDGEAWHLLGAALLEGGKGDEARAAFEKAVRAARPYPEARYFLALGDVAAGRTADAAAQLARLIAERPAHWHGRLLLAYLLGTPVGGGPRAVVAANARGRDEARPSTALAAALASEDPADPRAAWVLWQAAAAAGQPKLAAEAKAAFEALSAEPGAKRRMDEFLAAAHGRYMPARRYRMAPPSTRPATRPAKSRSLK